MARVGPLAWLDFRADDLVKSREFLFSLSDEGVLDELGFLALFGAFADIFYPATTTVMSSARYLYFIAGIYRQLEREKTVRSSNVAAEARLRQDELRQALANVESVGVIGRDAKGDVKQLPSTIYWSSLRRLGFFTTDLSERAYHDRFDEIRRAKRGFEDDDEAAQSVAVPAFWDDLPQAVFLDRDGHPRADTSFTMTRAEARDLSNRFEAMFGRSLLVHQIRKGVSACDRPWDAHSPGEYLEHHLKLAKRVSLFARGVTLHYYRLVMDAREVAKLEPVSDTVTPAFELWWQEARSELKAWDPSELASTDAGTALRHGFGGDVAFMSAWLARLSAASRPSVLMGDTRARELVRNREIAVKKHKARLKSPVHLKQWLLPSLQETPFQLDYRHRIGMRFVAEILSGMEQRQ